MRRALALAQRGLGRVEPNPLVGCVLVKGGRVVGEGYHRRFGGPHAEVWALRAAGAKARGATAYITLEPCCHFGKTPPCTDALIAAGVARVVAAMRDPFAPVAGKGLAALKKAGVNVAAGLLEDKAMRLNGPYLVRQRLQRPWVILKWAQSLDGKLATHAGDSKWISSPPSRQAAHRLRGRVDAIVIGVGTAIADDPQLTCRHGRPRRLATRVVFDPSLRTPPDARLVRTARQVPTWIVTREQLVDSSRAGALHRAGVELMAAKHVRGNVDLSALLRSFAARGWSNIMVEGGGETLGRFWDAGLADEAVVFVAPRLIGGRGAVPALGGGGLARVSDGRSPIQVERRLLGGDACYRLLFTDAARLRR